MNTMKRENTCDQGRPEAGQYLKHRQLKLQEELLLFCPAALNAANEPRLQRFLLFNHHF